MQVDNHEPDKIMPLLKQSTGAGWSDLNGKGWADYMWMRHDGIPEHAERKQMGEILADMSGVEEQVRKEVENYPDSPLFMIWEGWYMPGEDGGMYALQAEKTRGGMNLKRGYWYEHESLARLEAFRLGLMRANVRVIQTLDLTHTAQTLVMLEKSAQHPTTTLNRYVRPNITFHPVAYVENLMNLRMPGIDRKTKKERPQSIGIGPELAQRIIKARGTPANVINITPQSLSDEVIGLGVTKARNLQAAFGVYYD